MIDIVTGGAGAIGYQFATYLQGQGREVAIVDNFIRGDRDGRLEALLQMPGVTLFDGDLCDVDFVRSLPDAERVFHFAAYNGTENFYEHPMEVLRHCTMPTLNLVERYMERQQVKLFAYTGSSESYAGAVKLGLSDVPTPEDTPLVITDIINPRWSYATGKLHGEVATALGGNQYNVPWQVWRVHNCFGPRMGAKHVIPDFTERAVRGVYELYGAYDTRSFIYVRDAVHCMASLAETRAAAGQIINVGGTDEMTMLELGHAILRVLNVEAEIKIHDSPAGSIARRRPDINKLQSLVDVEFTDFETALRITVESIMDDLKYGEYSTK